MTRLKRMRVVDAWLSSDQSMVNFAKDQGVDLCDLLDWVMAYGQPPEPLRWIPVRIFGAFVDNHRTDGGFPDRCSRPDVASPNVVGRHWVPVVIQERS